MTGRIAAALLCAAALAAGGCTHRALTRNTVFAAGTVVEIQYETVLNNLARMSCNPHDLPSHIDLADGVVQVSDEASFGRAGGFDSLAGGGGGFGIDRFGPAAGRQISEQWGADATTDPQRLVDLQDLYRAALGLNPLPPPLAIALLRKDQEESGGTVGTSSPSSGRSGGSGGSGSGGGGSPDDAGSPPDDSAAGGGNSDANSGGGGGSGSGRRGRRVVGEPAGPDRGAADGRAAAGVVRDRGRRRTCRTAPATSAGTGTGTPG